MIRIATLLAGTLVAAGAAHAQQHMHSQMHQPGVIPAAATPAPAGAEVPLWPGLGTTTFPITTSNPEAQRYFDQGLVLTYGFNHWEAQRSFQKAQELDPACAMCFWGDALVLGPNINWPMQPEAVEPAVAALKEAERLAPAASEKERALITALSARYSDDPKADRATLDRGYADAMQRAAEWYPKDLDIASLYAEALMDLSPWNYWGEGGKTPTGRTADIVATLERVLAANPDHIGAIHLYIHAVEASDRPERAEPYADRLAALKLSTGHLVHMPSHIYFRVGRYTDSLAVNKTAVEADEDYLGKVKAEGIYPYAYYPHNIHFVLVSAQMAGDGATVIEAAEKLDKTIPDEAARTIPLAQPVKVAPLFAHAQFSPPATVLGLAEPADDLPYIKAIWHYARGVALATKGDLAAAKAEADAIAKINATANLTALAEAGVPAADVLNIAHHVVLGRIAQAEGNLKAAIAEFEQAAGMERALPYMEPAYWYYPIGQSLGAVLLLAGETERAEAVFSESLETVPNNGWACFGLAEAYKRSGKTAEAEKMLERLGRTWAGDPSLLSLNRL